MAEKSSRMDNTTDNTGLAEAINRLADAVELLRMDFHRYFSEEMPTGKVRHGDDI